MSTNDIRLEVGHPVRIVRGREVGQSGIIVMILQRGGEPHYVVDLGSGQRTYRNADEVVLEKS